MLFLAVLFFEGILSQGTNQTYLVKKDSISGLKGGEFTVYDSEGKNQLFRMESKVGVISDYRSASFVDLNNEQRAPELPGHLKNLNDQCRRAFSVNFEYCKDLSHEPKCNRLYCREVYTNLSSCITNHAHWSDGTSCSDTRAEIKRCFRGECRTKQDLQPIHGNWGEWLPWSPCTRTCGSAIQKSQRLCDSPKLENGGHYCSGLSTRIRSCENNPACKDPLDMFRQHQCSVFNNRTIDPLLPRGVRFEPKYNVLTSERCKLICKVSDDRLERAFVLGDRVEDGTPCGREEETRDICINGVCMPIGCDHKYASNATEDVCGVCNGQNKTCKLMNGQRVVSDFGITNIIDIPVNTTRVSVTQISSGNDRYYLAVKHANGTYVLNGMHSLQLYNVKLRIGDATLFYTGSDSSNETVLITGRLKVPLEIQVISIYQAGAPAALVKWEYYSPLDEGELARQHGGEPLDYHSRYKMPYTHNVNLYRGKEKTKPLALLKGEFTAILYRASISILNVETNQFNNGTIQQNGNKFLINYDNINISMEGKAASFDTTFIDQSNQNILAKFRKRMSSLFWRNKYDLQVFSNKFPDQIYFLGVAARDYTNKKILSG